MTKVPTLTEKKIQKNETTQNPHQKFDYTTIAELLRTVSGNNNSLPAGVVKPVYERSTSLLNAKVV